MATFIQPPESARTRSNDELIPVYVWQWPVRITHWMLVLSLVVLTVTGFYLHSPYIEPHGPRAWVMGTVRFIHELFGFILIATFILRVYWYFAGNRWAHWRAFVPLTRGQWTRLRSMIAYYTFQRRTPIPEIGHNPLAAIFYLGVFFLVAVECLTGLILYGVVSESRFLTILLGWIPGLINIQYIRTTHYFVMFLFMAFLVHHVYSAILVAKEERNGLMESIFTGWKFIPWSSVRNQTHDTSPLESRPTGQMENSPRGEQ
jgi:Ni/Fe-hydrogenase 1 B-type cytochrome subunit